MATMKKSGEEPAPKRRPRTTPQGRENEMVNLAFAVAEKQMRDGTASAQVITHYLKLGSSREREEQNRLRSENALLKEKINSMASMQESGSSAKEALDAFRAYAGQEPGQDDDYYDG